MKLDSSIWGASASFLCAVAAVVPSHAQTAAEFYNNRQMTMIVGTTAGGGYDIFGRMFARHMGRHLPGGTARFVVKNMPGAGGLVASNFVFNVADRDGATIAIVNREALLEPVLSVDGSQARFDPRRFTWLGSPNLEVGMIYVSTASGIRSIEETKQRTTTLGTSSSVNSTGVTIPRLLNQLMGTRFKVIAGYPGSMESILAMERGEVDGRYSPGWAGPEANKVNDLVAAGKARLLAYLSPVSEPALGGLPNAMDLPMQADNRVVLRLLLAAQGLGRPFFAPPGIADDRVRALRSAFTATMRDPEFLAEAAQQMLEIMPIPETDLVGILDQVYATPAPLLRRTIEMIGDAQR